MNMRRLMVTVGGLRLRQIIFRVWRGVSRRFSGRPPHVASASMTMPSKAVATLARRLVTAALVGRGDASLLLARPLEFLGEPAASMEVEWMPAGRSPLWVYHLHYFNYAVTMAAAAECAPEVRIAACERWIRSWIRDQRNTRGPGWDAYPTSLRIVNWIYVDALLAGCGAYGPWRQEVLQSLRSQLAWLDGRVEWEVDGNHLIKNARALIVGGAYFGGSDGASWAERGRNLLCACLRDQFLSDGGHLERSPMYHLQVTTDLLELVAWDAAGLVAIRDAIDAVLPRALDVVSVLRMPDGGIPLFNDSARQAEAEPEAVLGLARDLGYEPADAGARDFLPVMGYAILRDPARGECLVIDGGAPGPRHLPAHVHCDLLSFELWVGGRPFIVDSGVPGYGGHPLREYVRSTRAHNTVSMLGREQSDVWRVFRVAGMARPEPMRLEGASAFAWRGTYRPWWSGRARHGRTVRRLSDGWSIEDDVRGVSGWVHSYLHIHPSWHVLVEEGGVRATCGELEAVIRSRDLGVPDVVHGRSLPPLGWYCPAFGTVLPASTLVWGMRVDGPRSFVTCVRWRRV